MRGPRNGIDIGLPSSQEVRSASSVTLTPSLLTKKAALRFLGGAPGQFSGSLGSEPAMPCCRFLAFATDAS
eukprot:13317198-Alexandrium_andersonii.AAC.1